MSFLSPIAMAIGAAIAVPLLVALYFLKLRRKQHSVPSTLLWKKAIQDMEVNAPFQKLKRNLLLFLQLLALAAVLLALGRPVVPFVPEAGVATVILIDRSASMNATDGSNPETGQGRTRLEEAKRRAKELLDTLPRNGSAMVIAFDDSATTMQSFSSDVSMLKKRIDDITPSDRPTRLRAAFELAEAQSNFNTELVRSNVRPDVWVFSDGRVPDAADLRIQANLRYERIGSNQSANCGLVSVSARRNYDQPTRVQVFVRAANYGRDVVETDVQLSVDGKPRGVASLRLVPVTEDITPTDASASNQPPAETSPEVAPASPAANTVGTETAEFVLELTESAIVNVKLLPSRETGKWDVLSADDEVNIVVPPPRPVRLLLVSDGNNPYIAPLLPHLLAGSTRQMTSAQYAAWVDQSSSLLTSITPTTPNPTPTPTTPNPPASPANPTQPGGSLTDASGGFDVIVFDAVRPAKLPEAGNFIYFGTLPPGLDITAELAAADAAGGSSSAVPVVDTDPGEILDWERDHPLLRGLAMNRIYFDRTLRLKPGPGSRVLVFGTRFPVMVLHRQGRSAHLCLAFDPIRSNWPLRASWPVFVFNAIQYLATSSQLDVPASITPGTAVRLPASGIARLDESVKRIDVAGPGGRNTGVNITREKPTPAPQAAPSGGAAAATLTGSGDVTLPVMEHVGVYTLSPPVPPYEKLAVNLLDEDETNTRAQSQPPGNMGQATQMVGGQARLELWWWLIAAGLLPLLLAEWWVYTSRAG